MDRDCTFIFYFSPFFVPFFYFFKIILEWRFKEKETEHLLAEGTRMEGNERSYESKKRDE